MGGGCTANQTMIALSKEIWKVLLKKNITISAKYLPSALKKGGKLGGRKQQGLLGLETVSSGLVIPI